MKKLTKILSILAVCSLILVMSLTAFAEKESIALDKENSDTSSEVSSDVSGEEPVTVLYGDVNRDEEVNMKDVLALRKYLGKYEIDIDEKTSDVNRDEVADMKDVLLIRKYLAGLEKDLGAIPIQKLVTSAYTPAISNKVRDADLKLENYLNKKFENKNFVVSPASLNYVMALATLGANGDTRDQLLSFYGFEDLNDFYVYSKHLQEVCANLATEEYAPLRINGSAWINNQGGAAFTNAYTEALRQYFDADAFSLPSTEMQDRINQWFSDTTDGLLTNLIEEPVSSDVMVCLLNSLFLQDGWKFNMGAPEDGDFTTAKGETVKKKFMSKTLPYAYAEDDEGHQVVVVNTRRGIHVAFLLGDMDNPYELIDKAEDEDVLLTLPKFEVTSSYEDGDLIQYFKNSAALDAFTPQADFSSMTTSENIYISSLAQKTCVEVYQNGIQGFAGSIGLLSKEGYYAENPKEFTADRPFKFFVYVDDEDTFTTLFYGEINE